MTNKENFGEKTGPLDFNDQYTLKEYPYTEIHYVRNILTKTAKDMGFCEENINPICKSIDGVMAGVLRTTFMKFFNEGYSSRHNIVKK